MTVPVGRSGLYALVDDRDYELVSGYVWNVMNRPNGVVYARRTYRDDDGRLREQRMHTLITGWTETDHINLDGLDNRRENLRKATHSQNCANRRKPKHGRTSMFKGVHWNTRRQLWIASIMVHKRGLFLGGYPSEIEAAVAYDAAAVKYFGEFALLNLA
jgi:hypothetical protein